jgi:hypothetical protein
MHVGVAPYRGNLVSVAVHGKIVGLERDVEWQSPVRVTLSHLRGPVAMVQIDDIYAAHLTLPGFVEIIEQRRAGFAEFGTPPLVLPLPLKMIQQKFNTPVPQIITPFQTSHYDNLPIMTRGGPIETE